MTTTTRHRWLALAAGLAFATPALAQTEAGSTASRLRSNLSEAKVVTPDPVSTRSMRGAIRGLRSGGTPITIRSRSAINPTFIIDPTLEQPGPASTDDIISRPRLGNRITLGFAGRHDPTGGMPGGGGGGDPAGGGGGDGGPDGGNSVDNGQWQVLQPGAGFNGPTPTPSPVGDPGDFGFDAKAIARWDVVPYQTIGSEPFHIGVVAFHINGIERVDFSIEGGPWVSVYEMTENPRTKVMEYTVIVQPDLLDDGPVELRAIAWPKDAGEPRVLAGPMDWENEYQGAQWTGKHSMFLFNNAAGSTPDMVLELPGGTYTWGALPGVPRNIPNDRWFVIRPQDGAEVTIEPGLWRSQPDMVKLENIKLVQPGEEAHLRGSSGSLVWFDHVEFTGRGMYELANPIKAKHHFWTDSLVRDSRWGQAEHFVRNTRFERIGDDTINRSYFIVNTSVENLGTPPPHLSWHPGVIANPIEHDNRIYYNLDIVSRQKVFAFRNGTWDYWEHTDVAVVNCRAHKTTDGNQILYLGGQVNHMLIKDNVWRGDRSWNYRLNDRVSEPLWRFTPHNVLLKNNDWYGDPTWLPNPTPLPGVTVVPIGSVGR